MPHIVLLGDSIFDNAAYIAGGPDVVSQLGTVLPTGWRASLAAVDGAVITDVARQLARVPADATHLVISAGGNDALGHMDLLDRPARSSAQVLGWIADAALAFEERYRKMLATVLARRLPGRRRHASALDDAHQRRSQRRPAAAPAAAHRRDGLIFRNVESLSGMRPRHGGCERALHTHVCEAMTSMLTNAALVPEARWLTDRYLFVAELGRGGMGIVYLAHDRASGRSVAIKLLGTSHAGNAEAARRFAREARTVATLDHPHIVRTLAIEELSGGALAIVSEYVPGRTLRALLRESGPLAFDRAAELLRDVASALAYAHRFRIVHRDVKPENIFVHATSGHALLADFGIARALDSDTQLTSAGASLGTPSYMAPEQVKGSGVDERADVYSLGLVGWEMLTGVRPWEGETLYDVLHKQQHERLPSLAELRPDIPTYLLVAIEGALAKVPRERWSNGTELLVRLTPTPATLPPRRAAAGSVPPDDATVPLDAMTEALPGRSPALTASPDASHPIAPPSTPIDAATVSADPALPADTPPSVAASVDSQPTSNDNDALPVGTAARSAATEQAATEQAATEQAAAERAELASSATQNAEAVNAATQSTDPPSTEPQDAAIESGGAASIATDTTSDARSLDAVDTQVVPDRPPTSASPVAAISPVTTAPTAAPDPAATPAVQTTRDESRRVSPELVPRVIRSARPRADRSRSARDPSRSRANPSLRGPAVALVAVLLTLVVVIATQTRKRSGMAVIAGASRQEGSVMSGEVRLPDTPRSPAPNEPPVVRGVPSPPPVNPNPSRPVVRVDSTPPAAKPAPVARVDSSPPAANPAPVVRPPAQRPRAPAPVPSRVATQPPTAVPPRPASSSPSLPDVDGDKRCSSPTMTDQHACLLAQIDRNDAALTRTYHALIAQLRREAGGSSLEPPAVQALRVEQRAWIVQRDRACRVNPAATAGSLWGAERAPCFARASDDRDAVLRRRLQERRTGR